MQLALSLPDRRTRAVDVLTLGENSLDLVATVAGAVATDGKQPILDFAELPGGEAASAAAGVARLGWRAQYIGRFGDDPFGDRSRRSLEAEGVELGRVVVVPGVRSRFAMILVQADTGERSVLWQRDDRLALTPDDIPADAPGGACMLLVGSDDVEAMTHAARLAQAAGTRVIGDLERVREGTAELLGVLDVAIVSSSFPRALTGEADLHRATEAFADRTSARLVCVTLGARGCLARMGADEVHVPAFPIDAVDTTGAGDAFRAGFMAAWLREPQTPDVRRLLRYANAVAALNCRAHGAYAAAPRPFEVDALLGG